MNAYLPALAKESPEVVRILYEIQSIDHPPPDPDVRPSSEHPRLHYPDADSDANAPLIQHQPPSEEVVSLKALYDAELSRATSRISSLGIALGYGAGIVLLIVALVPVTILRGSTFSLRLAIGLSGLWWALFSVPAALWLPNEKDAGVGVSVEAWGDDGAVRDEEWSSWKEIVGAWKRLGSMLRWREIKKLRNTFKYLAAWFLLSDGM